MLTGALHRQPEWGDNVELFDPGPVRLPNAAAARPAALFKPFGTGARSCIGRQFALHEAAMAIARLVHRYRLIDSLPLCAAVGSPDQPPAGRIPARSDPAHPTRIAMPTHLAVAAAPPDRPQSQHPTPIKAGTTAGRACTARTSGPAGRWPSNSPTRPPTWAAPPRWRRSTSRRRLARSRGRRDHRVVVQRTAHRRRARVPHLAARRGCRAACGTQRSRFSASGTTTGPTPTRRSQAHRRTADRTRRRPSGPAGVGRHLGGSHRHGRGVLQRRCGRRWPSTSAIPTRRRSPRATNRSTSCVRSSAR